MRSKYTNWILAFKKISLSVIIRTLNFMRLKTAVRVSQRMCHNTNIPAKRISVLLIRSLNRSDPRGSTRATRVITAIIAFTRLSLRPWHFPTSRPKYNKELTANESAVQLVASFASKLNFYMKSAGRRQIFHHFFLHTNEAKSISDLAQLCAHAWLARGPAKFECSQHVASTCCPWRQCARGALLGKSLLKFRSVCVRARGRWIPLTLFLRRE